MEVFDVDQLKERLQGRLLAKVQYHLANAMREKNLSYDRLGEILLPMSEEILPHIAELFDKDYGLKVFSFTISRVLIDEDNTKKIQSAKDAHQKIEMDKAEKANNQENNGTNTQVKEVSKVPQTGQTRAIYVGIIVIITLCVAGIVALSMPKKNSSSGNGKH